MKNLFETKFWQENKLTASLRESHLSEPQNRDFLFLGDYAIGDDGCVYQCVSQDDAISFLIYDLDTETSEKKFGFPVSFNYAEDGQNYSLINDGCFDAVFSEVREDNFIGESEDYTVIELPIGESYFRFYAKEPGENPADVSFDTIDKKDLDYYGIIRK